MIGKNIEQNQSSPMDGTPINLFTITIRTCNNLSRGQCIDTYVAERATNLVHFYPCLYNSVKIHTNHTVTI